MSETSKNQAPRTQIMVVDDDEDILLWFRREFASSEQFQFHAFSSLEKAQSIITTQSLELDLVISDLEIGESSGFTLLEHCRVHYPTLPFCIITAHASVENTMEALRMGVFDYIQKPLTRKNIEMLIEKGLRFTEIKKENMRLRENLNAQSRLKSTFIAESPSMKEILEVVQRAAPSKASVLILGESGVGKEVIAKQVHLGSKRKNEVFLPVNCAALPENLIESELFGHTKGSFTGAHQASEGLIRSAHKGTLFLDEIGDLPLNLQAKLLRFLQEDTVRPVGSSQEHPVDVRVVAATNRNLVEQVRSGKFREDLYYRLNVVPLTIPPLRERPEDTKALVPFFLKSYAVQHNPKVSNISSQAHQSLMEYTWPGNVRELENTIERAVVLCRSHEIQLPDLMLNNFFQKAAPQATLASSPKEIAPDTPQEPPTPTTNAESSSDLPAPTHHEPPQELPTATSKAFHFEIAADTPVNLAELEKTYIEHICRKYEHSKEELADILGINRKTLYRKQKEYEIE